MYNKKQGKTMKEFYYTIEVTGYVRAKNKEKALKEVTHYKEHYMIDDPFPTIKVEEM